VVSATIDDEPVETFTRHLQRWSAGLEISKVEDPMAVRITYGWRTAGSQGETMTIHGTLKVVLGVLFIAAGVNHFVSPRFYLRIMPPYIPWHSAMVYASGAAEILRARSPLPEDSVLRPGVSSRSSSPCSRERAQALHPQDFQKISPAFLWARLPLQALLIAWAYWYTSAPAR
jgi:uncharacterized membrane protein